MYAYAYKYLTIIAEAFLGGLSCNFTTFSSGDPIPFVDQYTAPIRMDGDEAIHTGTTVDLKTGVKTYDLSALIDFSEQSGLQRYTHFTSSVDVNSLATIRFNSPTELAIFFRDSANNVFYQASHELTGSIESLIIVLNNDTGRLSVVVDSVEIDNVSLVIPANFSFDSFVISSNGASAQYSTMLLSSFSLTGLGLTSFISNKNNGLTFTSDEGKEWGVTEDVAGSSQINADGTSSTAYVWPESSRVAIHPIPATGATKLDNDYITYTAPIYVVHSNKDFKICIDANIVDAGGLEAFDYICDHGEAGKGAIRIRIREVGAQWQWQYIVNDDTGVQLLSEVVAVDIVGRHYSEMRFDFATSAFSFWVDGVHVPANNETVDLSNGLSIKEYQYGSRNDEQDTIVANVYEVCDTALSTLNLDVRLQGLDDPRAGKLDDDKGNLWTLADNPSSTAIYPNIGTYPTVHLVNDKWQTPTACITVPAGFAPMKDNGNWETDQEGNYLVAPV
jgi:hypothetical protein